MKKEILMQEQREGWLVETIRGGRYAFTNEDDLFGKFIKEQFVQFVKEARHLEDLATRDFIISFDTVSNESWQDLAKKKTEKIKGKELKRGKDEPV